MALYKLGIDETGSFALNGKDDSSFVCGVLTKISEDKIVSAYQQVYKDINSTNSAPTGSNLLSGFHFTESAPWHKTKFKEILLPLADEIYVSSGKPRLFANNQNWWLIAVTVVISEVLKSEKLNRGDSLIVHIDNRNDKTWGVTIDNEKSIIDFKDYHNYLVRQIEALISNIVKARGINVSISPLSDSCSYYINLADIICGLVRTDKNSVTKPITRCYCSNFMRGDDPISLKSTNPLAAISTIFQEVCNDKLDNIGLIDTQLLKRLRGDANYNILWDMFYDLVKVKISARRNHRNKLVGIKDLIDIFLVEFGIAKDLELLSGETILEVLNLFAEYFSHIGSTTIPFTDEDVLALLCYNGKNAETRLLRRWEKYVSYMLRKAQIDFNGYNFENVANRFSELWNHQEGILNQLMLLSGNENRSLKDEPTASIVGTLAQSYAYKGELDTAIEYFEMSREYTMRSSAQTNSFLLTIYQRKNDIAKMRECFVAQVGTTPEEYYEAKNFDDTWKLISYCRLRATELYVNKSTELKGVDYFEKINCKGEYPLPLAQKWEAIALYMENKDENKAKVENLFTLAIESLLLEENEFTIRTLALPIMQCFGFVNPQNKFHSRYNTLIGNEMLGKSVYFDNYVNACEQLLKISNSSNLSLWERALMLPFIYS